MKKQNILLEKLEAEMKAAKQIPLSTRENICSNVVQSYFLCSIHGKPFTVTFKKIGTVYKLESCDRILSTNGNNQEDLPNNEQKISDDKIDYSGWFCPWCGDKGDNFIHFGCKRCGRVCGGAYHKEKTQPKTKLLNGDRAKNEFFCHSCSQTQLFIVKEGSGCLAVNDTRHQLINSNLKQLSFKQKSHF